MWMCWRWNAILGGGGNFEVTWCKMLSPNFCNFRVWLSFIGFKWALIQEASPLSVNDHFRSLKKNKYICEEKRCSRWAPGELIPSFSSRSQRFTMSFCFLQKQAHSLNKNLDLLLLPPKTWQAGGWTGGERREGCWKVVSEHRGEKIMSCQQNEMKEVCFIGAHG